MTNGQGLNPEGFSSAGEALDFFGNSEEWKAGQDYGGPHFTHRLINGEWLQEGDGKTVNKTEEKKKESAADLAEHLEIIRDLQTKGCSIKIKKSEQIAAGKEVAKQDYEAKVHATVYVLRGDEIEIRDFEGTKKELEKLLIHELKLQEFLDLDDDDDLDGFMTPKIFSRASNSNLILGSGAIKKEEDSKSKSSWESFWENLLKPKADEHEHQGPGGHKGLLDLFGLKQDSAVSNQHEIGRELESEPKLFSFFSTLEKGLIEGEVIADNGASLETSLKSEHTHREDAEPLAGLIILPKFVTKSEPDLTPLFIPVPPVALEEGERTIVEVPLEDPTKNQEPLGFKAMEVVSAIRLSTIAEPSAKQKTNEAVKIEQPIAQPKAMAPEDVKPPILEQIKDGIVRPTKIEEITLKPQPVLRKSPERSSIEPKAVKIILKTSEPKAMTPKNTPQETRVKEDRVLINEVIKHDQREIPAIIDKKTLEKSEAVRDEALKISANALARQSAPRKVDVISLTRTDPTGVEKVKRDTLIKSIAPEQASVVKLDESTQDKAAMELQDLKARTVVVAGKIEINKQSQVLKEVVAEMMPVINYEQRSEQTPESIAQNKTTEKIFVTPAKTRAETQKLKTIYQVKTEITTSAKESKASPKQEIPVTELPQSQDQKNIITETVQKTPQMLQNQNEQKAVRPALKEPQIKIVEKPVALFVDLSIRTENTVDEVIEVIRIAVAENVGQKDKSELFI